MHPSSYWLLNPCASLQARFLEEFGDEEDEEQPSADAKAVKDKAHAGRGGALAEPKRSAVKPQEHSALFAGNLDDHFRLGIKITRCVGGAKKLGCLIRHTCSHSARETAPTTT